MSDRNPVHYKSRLPSGFRGPDTRPTLCGFTNPHHAHSSNREAVTCRHCLHALALDAEVDLALAAIDHLLGVLEERGRAAFSVETQRVVEYMEGAIRDALEGVDEPMVVIGALSSLLRKRMDTKIARRIMIKLAAELEGKG